MKKTNIFSVLAASAIVAATTLSPSEASAFGSAGTAKEATVLNKFKETFDNLQDLIDTVQQGFTGQTQQLSANQKAEIAAESNMKALQDERARQANIQKEVFAATRRSVSSHRECTRRTIAQRSSNFNRPDKRLSAETLSTLAKMASWQSGLPVGDSGVPIETQTAAQKEEAEDIVNEIHNQTVAGASYEFSVAKLHETNHENAEFAKQTCALFIQNLAGRTSEGIADVNDTDTADVARVKKQFRTRRAQSSIGETFFAQYCADRNPLQNADDASNEVIIKTAKDIPGYSEGDFKEGISYEEAYRVRSRKYAAEHKVGDPKEEQEALNAILEVVSWQAFQLSEIDNRLDIMNTVSSAQLMTQSQMLESLQIIEKIAE